MSNLVLNMPPKPADVRDHFEEFLRLAMGLEPELADACKGDYHLWLLIQADRLVDLEAIPDLGVQAVEIIRVEVDGHPYREPFQRCAEHTSEHRFVLSGMPVLDACQLLFLSRGASLGTVYYPYHKRNGEKAYDCVHSPFYDLAEELEEYPRKQEEEGDRYLYQLELHRGIMDTMKFED